jgi:hypothetical protein
MGRQDSAARIHRRRPGEATATFRAA